MSETFSGGCACGPMRRAFCPSCGSPLFLKNDLREGGWVLYAGNLDDPSMTECRKLPSRLPKPPSPRG
jgi:hypothetical protein